RRCAALPRQHCELRLRRLRQRRDPVPRRSCLRVLRGGWPPDADPGRGGDPGSASYPRRRSAPRDRVGDRRSGSGGVLTRSGRGVAARVEGAQGPPSRRPALASWRWLPLLLILAAAGGLHAPALRLPFFADDYLFLDQARFRSLIATLRA